MYLCSCFDNFVLSYDKFSCIFYVEQPKQIDIVRQENYKFDLRSDPYAIPFRILPSGPVYQANTKKYFCPAGWNLIGGVHLIHAIPTCYFVGSTKVDQLTAKQTCNNMNSHLATILDREKNYFLSKLFLNGVNFEPYWIGLEYNTNLSEYFWNQEITETATQRTETNEIIFVNEASGYGEGSGISNENSDIIKNELNLWQFGEPHQIVELLNNYCVLNNFGSNGVWSNEDCNFKARFACSKPADEL